MPRGRVESMIVLTSDQISMLKEMDVNPEDYMGTLSVTIYDKKGSKYDTCQTVVIAFHSLAAAPATGDYFLCAPFDPNSRDSPCALAAKLPPLGTNPCP